MDQGKVAKKLLVHGSSVVKNCYIVSINFAFLWMASDRTDECKKEPFFQTPLQTKIKAQVCVLQCIGCIPTFCYVCIFWAFLWIIFGSLRIKPLFFFIICLLLCLLFFFLHLKRTHKNKSRTKKLENLTIFYFAS